MATVTQDNEYDAVVRRLGFDPATCGDEVRGPCLAHGGDNETAASYKRGTARALVFKCFTNGCGIAELRLALDAIPTNGNGLPRPEPEFAEASLAPITLAELARHLGLAEEWLTESGWRDEGGSVAIPYFDPTTRRWIPRYRLTLDGGQKFSWPKGTKVSEVGLLYGTPHTINALDTGVLDGQGVLLVGGESDTVTVFHGVGLHALGLAGEGIWSAAIEERLRKLGTIYAIIEPDSGGERLLANLGASDLQVRIVRLDAKDARASYLLDPATFRERFDAALAAAEAPTPEPVELPAPAPAATDKPSLLFHTATEILRTERRLPRYDIPGLVSAGAMTAFGGYTGDGKTPFLTKLLSTALAGGEFVGIEVERLPEDYRIVYLTQETLATFQPVLQRAGLLETERFEAVYLHEALGLGVPWGEIVRQAFERVGQRGLVVVDPLVDWAQAENEDSNAIMAAAFRPIVQHMDETRSGLVVAHSWKTFVKVPDEEADVQHIRGAGAIVSNATIIALYKKTPLELGKDIRFLKVARDRNGVQFEPRYVGLKGNDWRKVTETELIYDGQADNADRLLRQIKAAGEEGIRLSKLRDESGIHTRDLRPALDSLLVRDRISEHGTPKSTKDPLWYRSADFEENPHETEHHKEF